MFYAVLGLFLKAGINAKTSKHAGVISVFDKEFIHAGKLDIRYSKILHKIFEARQTIDYKELAEVTLEEATGHVKAAREFVDAMRQLIA
jgi:uncharacterized protein (UPF0332 family)